METDDAIKRIKEESTNKTKDTFLRLPRVWRDEYIENKLSIDELLTLIWLAWNANPHNGKVKTSYEEIASDFRGKYKKNKVNKIMLSLKRKKYVWFPKIQGRRSSFYVEIDRYPLSNKLEKRIDKYHKKQGSKSDEEEMGEEGYMFRKSPEDQEITEQEYGS